jgi:hypothetical protein
VDAFLERFATRSTASGPHLTWSGRRPRCRTLSSLAVAVAILRVHDSAGEHLAGLVAGIA